MKMGCYCLSSRSKGIQPPTCCALLFPSKIKALTAVNQSGHSEIASYDDIVPKIDRYNPDRWLSRRSKQMFLAVKMVPSAEANKRIPFPTRPTYVLWEFLICGKPIRAYPAKKSTSRESRGPNCAVLSPSGVSNPFWTGCDKVSILERVSIAPTIYSLACGMLPLP